MKFCRIRLERIGNSFDSLGTIWEVEIIMLIFPGINDILAIVAESLQVKRLAKENIIKSDDYRSPNVQMLMGESSWVETIDNGVK